MVKLFKTVLFSALVLAAFSGCQTGDKSVRDAARQSIEGTNTTVAPVQAEPTATAEPAASPVPAGPVTEITFNEQRYNFGTIEAGKKVKHVYKFKNTGKEPLVLTDARSTCGCTVPQWPREPIAPGGTGELIVEFDSSGKSGSQSKRVTVVGNTNPPETFVYIEGDITTPATGNNK